MCRFVTRDSQRSLLLAVPVTTHPLPSQGFKRETVLFLDRSLRGNSFTVEKPVRRRHHTKLDRWRSESSGRGRSRRPEDSSLLRPSSALTAFSRTVSTVGDLNLCLGRALSGPYQECKTPDDIARRVIETHKPLHDDKVTVHGEELLLYKCHS